MERIETYVVLGLNHHLLFHEGVSDPGFHERSLGRVLSDPRLEAVDLWIPDEPRVRDREIDACLASGKQIIYNIGSRAGKPSAQPASLDPQMREYSLAFYRHELDNAAAVKAAKVVTNSGPDQPGNREEALEALVDFYERICAYAGPDMLILIEPTDRDMSKRKLIGPSIEAGDLVRRLWSRGVTNIASMVDMGHVPLMHETLGQAFRDSAGVIGHVHLGNCIVRDRAHPLFGDKHVPWGIAGGEYDVDDVVAAFEAAFAVGYLGGVERATVSFEMRPYPHMTPEQSLGVFFGKLGAAWQQLCAAGIPGV